MRPTVLEFGAGWLGAEGSPRSPGVRPSTPGRAGGTWRVGGSNGLRAARAPTTYPFTPQHGDENPGRLHDGSRSPGDAPPGGPAESFRALAGAALSTALASLAIGAADTPPLAIRLAADAATFPTTRLVPATALLVAPEAPVRGRAPVHPEHGQRRSQGPSNQCLDGAPPGLRLRQRPRQLFEPLGVHDRSSIPFHDAPERRSTADAGWTLPPSP